MVSKAKPKQANTQQVGGTHYLDKAIQPWDYITANGIPYLEGCIVKYVTRWREKGGLADLMKAKHYIEKLIENADAANTGGTESVLYSLVKK